MASDDELKDEELVDFEGSDYELDCDYEGLENLDTDEEEAEEVAAKQQPSDLPQTELRGRSAVETKQDGSNDAPEPLKNYALLGANASLNAAGSKGSSTCEGSENLKEAEAASGCADGSEGLRTQDFRKSVTAIISGSDTTVTSSLKALITSRQVSSKDSVKSDNASDAGLRVQQLKTSQGDKECAELKEARDENDKKDTLWMHPSLILDGSDAHCEPEIEGNRLVKFSKPDLEDGELDESAVLQNYGFEEMKEETAEREIKRRKESFFMGRKVGQTETNAAKQLEETGDSTAKQYHNSSSDNAVEQFAGLSSAGGRSTGLRMAGLGQGSLAPGIMGPGRPLLPIGIGNMAQGFGPLGAILPHGQPQIHLQEVLAQEHLFRAHALQLAQETLVNAIRPPLMRPLGAAAIQPFLGFDVLGPRSLTPKHFPRPPDLLLGPMGNFARGQRPNLARGRANITGKVGGQADPILNNGVGRQFSWSAGSGPSEMLALKRGRGTGGGLRTGPWVDAEPFGIVPGGLGLAGNPRAMMNVTATTNMRHANLDKALFNQTALPAPQDFAHSVFDARWKIEKERMLKNCLPHFRMPGDEMIGEKLSDASAEPGKFGESKFSRPVESSRSGSLASRLGPPVQPKVKPSNLIDSGDSAPGSNVIKLHQPVRKSRVLTVSGLPEDTPMSTVAEVFEKLGKITDFKKSSRGDTFTISYSSETEAVTAKRNLHRSCLAGKQITVDYTHQ